MDLRIRRMRNVYLHDGAQADAAVRHRLDGVVDRVLRDALDTLVTGALHTAGVPEDAEVAVRRIGVRVHVQDGSEIGDAEVGVAWARALADALAALVRDAVRAGGEAEDCVVFPTRVAAEQAYLVQRSLGQPPRWWWQPVLDRERTGVPSPEDVLLGWVERSPADAPHLVLDWMGSVPAHWSGALSPAAAGRVAVALAARRRATLQELTHRGGIAASVARETAGASGTEEAEVEIRRVAGSLPPSAALRHAATMQHVRLAALAVALVERPSIAVHRPEVLEAVVAALEPRLGEGGTRVAAPVSPGATASPRTRAAEAKEAGPVPAPAGSTAGSAPVPNASPQRPEVGGEAAPAAEPGGARASRPRVASRSSSQTWEVGLGGLLFAIRWLSRHPILEGLGPAGLEDLLLRVGVRAIHLATDGLAAVERRAVFTREMPVLCVFTGCEQLPDRLWEQDTQTAPFAPARRVVDDLADRLPADLAFAPGGVRFTWGRRTPDWRDGSPRTRVAALVLRRGHLSVTRTHADLALPMSGVDVTLRRGGWDVDPAWVPHLGRIIRFHYHKAT